MSTTPLKKVDAPAKAKPSPVDPKAPKTPRLDVPGELPAAQGPAQDAAAAVALLRKRRARRLAKRAGLGIGVPAILASVYFFGIASPQYESVSMFMVQSADSRASVGLETLIGAVPGAGATRDALAVRDYILSREMLALLDKELGY